MARACVCACVCACVGVVVVVVGGSRLCVGGGGGGVSTDYPDTEIDEDRSPAVPGCRFQPSHPSYYLTKQ